MISDVLVGGHDPDLILREAERRTRLSRESQQALDEKAAQDQRQRDQAATQAYPFFTTGFTIEDRGTFYRVSRDRPNQTDTWEFTKGLLRNRQCRRQSEWKNHNHFVTHDPSKIDECDRFSVPPLEEYLGLFQILYHNREHANPSYRQLVEQARSGIEKLLERTHLMTISKTEYRPFGNDLVFHADSVVSEHPGSLAGPNGEILTLPDADALALTLHGTDAQSLNDIMRWATGKTLWIARRSTPPDSRQYHPILLGKNLRLSDPVHATLKEIGEEFIDDPIYPSMGIRSIEQSPGGAP